MSAEIAIQVSNVSKCFRLFDNPQDRLKQMVVRGDKKYYKEFWALNEVSFTLSHGQALGIIGRNGSGKSTLLQLICHTLQATSGANYYPWKNCSPLRIGHGF